MEQLSTIILNVACFKGKSSWYSVTENVRMRTDDLQNNWNKFELRSSDLNDRWWAKTTGMPIAPLIANPVTISSLP